MTFVSAEVSGPQAVTYKGDDGSELIRQGGSRSWRNNNPGNIEKGSFADHCGAIGDDSRFAIFPDETTGMQAVISLLKGKAYQSLTLEEAIYKYAPSSENSTAGYVSFVERQTAINRSTVLSTLKPAQLLSLAKAIQTMEGWIPGTERTTGAAAGDMRPPGAAAMRGFAAALSPDVGTGASSNAAERHFTYEQATGSMYLTEGGSNDLYGTGYSGSEAHGGKTILTPNVKKTSDRSLAAPTP